MYEGFGAAVSGRSVEFRLFFPDVAIDPSQYVNGGTPKIAKLQVTGDFQPLLRGNVWDHENAPELEKTEHPNGWLYTYRLDDVPDGFYQYKYFVTFENDTTRWCGDPCTKYVAGVDENAGFVVGGHKVSVRPLAQRPAYKDLVIYELMIDDFTAEYRDTRAPVDAVLDKLDHLIDLGVNAIEFMPWTAWRGRGFSWGYDPYLFFAVENRLIEAPGEPLDRLYRLGRLFDTLHERGIAVIKDGVFNHVNAGLDPGNGFPYHWLYQDPSESPFTGGFAKGGFFEDFDYNNQCTHQFILDVCKFWVDVYQIDGIRFDYTLGFHLKGDHSRGIPKLVADLKDHLANAGQEHFHMMLEHLTDNRYEAIDDTNQICAEGCWYDRFLYDVPDQAAAGNLQPSIMRVIDTNRDFQGGKGPVTYIENHDHSTVVNRVGGRDRWWKTQPPLLSLLTVPGAVLIHNGQEFGDDHYVPNSGPDRVQARPVHWNHLTDAVGVRLFDLYRHLIRLRRDHPALRTANFYPSHYDERQTHFNEFGYGVNIDQDVLIYHRWGQGTSGTLERFLIVVNFSAFDQYVNVPFSANGTWHELLDGGSVHIQNHWLWNERIHSHWGKIFLK